MFDPQTVKAQLVHTWPFFFARHGRFTAVQQQAIPPILDGHDTLVISATASGKTEAVLAPLLERYWTQASRPQPPGALTLLYICPTRALVRDLYNRLQLPLADARISLAMKTGDTGPVDSERPPSLLLTTPESLDALLIRAPRLFIPVQAAVLDEIHLFDKTPRGDHLRCLLARLERIRNYANPEVTSAQRVALSATVADPKGVAERYLQPPEVITNVPGRRHITADIHPLYDLSELAIALGQRAAQKSLLFCNTREEVEQTAAYLRRHLPHHAEVFVHYSNLDAQVRQEVESRFAEAAVAICVCTSTLELGIDIGSVDDIVLLGAPHNLTSFLQRIGRGGRRKGGTRVLCLPKSPGEWARFEAMLGLAEGRRPLSEEPAAYAFRPSVLVQQIFSLIQQNPTGAVRIADLRRITPPEITDETIGQILTHLALSRFLQKGRPGEWRPDSLLQELIDRREIYSNIGSDALEAVAVDAYSGRVLAHTERVYEKGTVLLFGGKVRQVVWRDKTRYGLAPAAGKEVDHVLRLGFAYAVIPFAMTQAVARDLGLQPGQIAAVPAELGVWLYHFWGTVWGELLAGILLAQGIEADPINEYCLYARPAIERLPAWDAAIGQQVAAGLAATLAERLEMGRFHPLLPPNIANTAAGQQLNLDSFGQVYQAAVLQPAGEMAETLHQLRQ
jgi:ATP-dependent Lhr-like helicase